MGIHNARVRSWDNSVSILGLPRGKSHFGALDLVVIIDMIPLWDSKLTLKRVI